MSDRQLPASIDQAMFQQLTPREQAFVMHPLVYTDPQQAAIDIGYAKTTAHSKAHAMRHQLMHYIMPFHQRRMDEISSSTLDRIVEELEAIAFAVETDYYDTIDVAGDTVKVLKDVTRLPRPMQRAIKSVEFETIVDPEGKSTQRLVKIVLHDKQAALKELAEIKGFKDPRMRSPVNPEAEANELLQHVTPEEKELVEKIYRKAQQRQAKAKSAPITATVVKPKR